MSSSVCIHYLLHYLLNLGIMFTLCLDQTHAAHARSAPPRGSRSSSRARRASDPHYAVSVMSVTIVGPIAWA